MKTLRDVQWSKDGLSRELSDWELIVENGVGDLFDCEGDVLHEVANMIDNGSNISEIGSYVLQQVTLLIDDKAGELRDES